jgi:4-amino-4-deoxy-L-arabinose transferase-like glycosyltransferase
VSAASPPQRRPIRPASYLILAALFTAIVIPSHLWLVQLPYYWDEAGQFIPAALDIFRDGAWIPRSTVPNIHPPGVMAYLAAAWHVAGFTPVVTRMAMLILATAGVLAAFLLEVELARGASGRPAFLAAGLLMASPLFFAQSLLAQLDVPAMLFTTIALLLFLQERIRWSAAACVALVMVKETGLVVPVVFAAWLLRERRYRDAAWFALPAAAVAGWIAALAHATGHWAGNAGFAQYNLYYPLHPVRLVLTLLRRLYFLFAANFHWIGTLAIAYAWRKSPVFRTRPWGVAAILVAAHVLMLTVLGGAVLNRYLLPILPVLFAAMAVGLSVLPRVPRVAAAAILVGGLIACNFINPPYPFPFEENLAFADFVNLHHDAAEYIAHWYLDPVVETAWPMSAELAHPELGFVPRPIRVAALPNLTPDTLASLDWTKTQIVVVFSRTWNPPLNLLRIGPLRNLWGRFYSFQPGATLEEARASVPFPVEAHFSRRGQWVDIYVNPDLPSAPPVPVRVAAVKP